MEDFTQSIEEIKICIAEDNLKEVYRNLSFVAERYTADKRIQNEIIILYNNYSKLKRDHLLGLIGDFYEEGRNQNIRKVLEIINIIEEENIKIISPINNLLNERNRSHETFGDNRPYEKNICSAKEISKKYRGFELAPISFDLNAGEITVVTGQNGSGKTTLLKLMAGEVLSDNGEIIYEGFRCKKNYYYIKKQIGFVSQELPNPGLDIISWMKLSASTNQISSKESSFFINDAVLKLDLEEHLFKKWKNISQGYKLRISLANIMVWRPKLIILDEPLANLDFLAQKFLLSTLKKYADSNKYPLSILISSQHIEEVEAIADNIIFLHKGQVKYNGKKKFLEERFQFKLFVINTNLKLSLLEKLFEGDRYLFEILSFDRGEAMLKVDKSISVFELFKRIEHFKGSVNSFNDISNSSKRFLV